MGGNEGKEKLMTAPLKEWLDRQDTCEYDEVDENRLIAALRAVVELHQPIPEFEPEPGEVAHCKDCEWIWPCPTIRAIEKEVLK